MTPFEDYFFDSNRQNKFNRSQPKSKPEEIKVYVEDKSDVAFWHGILSPYANQNSITFKITPYTENNASTGKDKLVKQFSHVNKNILICLDSDYDYLLQSKVAQDIEKYKPYIFQTYAYAMENLKCYAESLNNLCVKATNSTNNTVDLADFLKSYSRIIYPLLLWNLYGNSKKKNKPSRKNFAKLVTFGNTDFNDYVITPDNFQEKLTIIKKSVDKELKSITTDESFITFSQNLTPLGLNEENAYLFINGHYLYDFVSKFLIAICDELKKEAEDEIIRLANEKNRESKVKGYENSITDVTSLLNHNDKFTDCPFFKKIKTDIESYLATFKQHTQGMNHV
jgi:hypothetical protein